MKNLGRCFVACLTCLMPLQLMATNVMNIHSAMDVTSANSVAAWEAYTGVDVEIHAATEIGLGLWSATNTLSDPSVSINNRNPRTVINSLGNCAVVWIGLDPIFFVERLYGSLYNGVVWTLPQAISDINETIVNDNFNLSIGNASSAVKLTWSSYMAGSFVARSLNSPIFGTWGALINTFVP